MPFDEIQMEKLRKPSRCIKLIMRPDMTRVGEFDSAFRIPADL